MTALRDAIDYTTLGWVKPEVDETLRQARIEIEGFAEDPTDATRMRFCASYLHQVQGTLRMVELYAPAMVVEEMEQLALALQLGDISDADRDPACATLMRGVVLLPDYLERLQSGHRDIPIVLLPLLNELRAARGQNGLSESVLFAPDLARPLPDTLPPVDVTAARPRALEMLPMVERLSAAVAAWPEHSAPLDSDELHAAIDALLARTRQDDTRRMLWVASSLASALRDGKLSSSASLRQAFASVQREARRQFEDDGFGSPNPETTLEPTRQLLYHVALGERDHPALAELRETFDLDAQQPTDSELSHAQSSLTGRNRALLDTVAGAVKEDLLRVKDALDLHLRATDADVASLQPQVESLGRVADTLGMLGLGVARNVVQQQRDAMRAIVSGERTPDEGALLDVAGALLYVDATLDDQVARLGSNDDAAGSQDDLFSAESRTLMEVIAREAIANFADARQAFVAFVETSWDHGELAEVPRLLREVSGAMTMLELSQPAGYLDGVRMYTEVELIGRKRVPNGRQLDTFADALASLEYYLEALREHRGNRDNILDIARNSLETLGYWPLPDIQAAVAVDVPADTRADESTNDIERTVAAFIDRGVAVGPVATPADSNAAAAGTLLATAVPTLPERGEVIGGFETTGDEIDDEIREIFIEEFGEEIDNLSTLLPPWRAEPDNMERLRPIRRVFHTLKGSGRLVGARVLGEFSWKVESMLNRVLDKTREPSPAVLAMVDTAFDTLPQLLAVLRGDANGINADLAALQAVAERVTEGEEIFASATAAKPADLPVTDVAATGLGEANDTGAAGAESNADSEAPGTVRASVDALLLEILETEVSGHLVTLDNWLVAARFVPTQATDALLRATHTMNGAFAMTDVPSITDALGPAEGYIRRLFSSGGTVDGAGVAALTELTQLVRATMAALNSPAPMVPTCAVLAGTLVALRDSLPDKASAPASSTMPDTPYAQADDHAAPLAQSGVPATVDDAAVQLSSDAVDTYDGASAHDEALELTDTDLSAFASFADSAGDHDQIADVDAAAAAVGAIEAADAVVQEYAAADLAGLATTAESVDRVPGDEVPVADHMSAAESDNGVADQTASAADADADATVSADATAALGQAVAVEDATAATVTTTATAADDGPSDAEDIEARLASQTEADMLGAERIAAEHVEQEDMIEDESAAGDAQAVETPAVEIPADADAASSSSDTGADDTAADAVVAHDATLDTAGEPFSAGDAAHFDAAAMDDDAAAEQSRAAERAEAERLEAQRIAVEEELEYARLEQEYAEADRLAREERAQVEREAAETAEAQRQQVEAEIAAAEAAAEAGRSAQADAEAEARRLGAEREAEATAVAEARAEADRLAALQAEFDRQDAERIEAERLEADRAEAERLEAEQLEADRIEIESIEAKRIEAERVEVDRLDAERIEREAFERAEADRLAAEAAQRAQVEADSVADIDSHDVGQVDHAKDIASDIAVDTMLARLVGNAQGGVTDPDVAFDFSGLDPELVDIFVEEAGDLLDHSDGVLAQLRESPGEREPLVALQRDLHTIKGGARMAGVMAIGELGHAMESLLEAVVDHRSEIGGDGVPLLERGFDRLHAMVTRVGSRLAIDPSESLIAEFNDRASGARTPARDPVTLGEIRLPAPKVQLAPLSSPLDDALSADDDDIGVRAPQEQVRIRADLLDRLVTYAGEVAIYRARLEQQLGAFRGAMGEMEQTNMRLRDQLRRLDIETEAQIVARFQREQDTTDKTFDPLELDRFSTLQQLSRALGESAADMSSLQGTLDDLTRQYETLLLQQSRVSSDLQEGLMRTRMVPFDALVPRLRRVVRQAASDTGKQVQLKLDGAQGELDRNVLERMTAPLEHMLRNAVAHGLEDSRGRRSADKSEEGTVRVAIRREGSEVVLEVGDDGIGLDRAAIRRRAEERGLLRSDAVLADSDLDAMILQPGFSTAGEVSRLAGRGVGMDVVASEVRQLGGTLDIASRRGEGTTFTLRLPQTLAVTQAVFVKIGDTSFAVPIASVRGVGRLSRDVLDGAEASYAYGGEDYLVHDLGGLVGQPAAKAEGQLQMPVLLIRAGELRAAVVVDQILGNREIVVKPVGPQVASIPGIFGATVMGDGRVVVILDVAPLVRRQSVQPRDVEPAATVEQRRIPLVMVVDDSVTMRKVTGRVLERHNFEVASARDGIDAIERMVDRVPDLMLLDIEMPRMDGYELATHMKADPRLRDVPIVMITSRTGEKHRQRAFEIGVERYLGKPYQENELIRNVYELLKMEQRGDG